jgi:hypothetical protein
MFPCHLLIRSAQILAEADRAAAERPFLERQQQKQALLQRQKSLAGGGSGTVTGGAGGGAGGGIFGGGSSIEDAMLATKRRFRRLSQLPPSEIQARG